MIQRDEQASLARFRELHDVLQPISIEKERAGLNITEKEKEYVEWEFRKRRGDDVPNTIPQGLKGSRESMKYFPTPGIAMGFVSDPGAKALLGRWHREYGKYSGYTHGGFLKGLPAMISDMGLTNKEREKVIEAEHLSAIMVSYLAIASACSEPAHAKLERSNGASRPDVGPDRVELLADLASLWDSLRKSALLGRILWEIRIRNLGTLLG